MRQNGRQRREKGRKHTKGKEIMVKKRGRKKTLRNKRK